MSNIERQQHPSHFVASQTIREKFRRYRLWRLRTLPDHVYRELIDRLHRGHACFSLAKWVLKLPDRGGMQNVGFWTIWKDIQVLAEEINAKRADSPRSIESLIPQPSGEKIQAKDQRNSPLPGSPNKLGRVEDHASEDAKSPSRTVVLQSLFDHNWEALEHCGILEEDLLEKGLPVQAPMYARLRLITKQLKILIELPRNEAEEELKQKAVERSTAQLPQEKSDAEDKVENSLPGLPE